MSTLKLKVQKYRRFAEAQEIAFQPGLTIISGSNGAGKSTLVEAILFALFGSGRDSSVGEIRTDKSKGDPLVECELFIDDQLIHIIRVGNSVEVSINGVVQVMRSSSSAKAANKRVSALLGGLTRDQFESSYVAIQGDTAGLVQFKAKERRILIERILQLEVLARAVDLQVKRRENAKSDLMALGNVICDELSFSQDMRRSLDNFQNARVVRMRMQYAQNFMVSIEQAISDQKGTLKEVEGYVLTARTHESDLKKQLNDHLSTIEQAVQAHQQHEARQKSYNTLQEDIASTEGKITQVKLDIQKFLDDIRNAMQYAEASAEYEQLQEEKERDKKRLVRIPLVTSCYDEFVRARTKLDVLDDQLVKLATIDEDLRSAQDQEKHAKQQLNTLRDNDPTFADYEVWRKGKDILDHEERQNRDALKQLETGTSDARCPTCNQPFNEHTRERRIQHLLTWLNETSPLIREQLQQQKQHIDEEKQQWEEAKKLAEQEYGRLQKDTVTAEKKVSARDTLSQQRAGLYPDFQAKQKAWLELKEEPDSEEETKLLSKLEETKLPGKLDELTLCLQTLKTEEETRLINKLDELTLYLQTLKTRADEYAQIPFIEKNLADKKQSQEGLDREKQALLERQSVLGYDAEAFQTSKDRVEELRKEETKIRNLLHQAELDLQSLQTDFQQVEKSVAKIQEYHDRFGTYVQEYYREERLCEHLNDFKKHFFEANTGEVMRRTTQLLTHAITDQSILGVRFDKDEFQYLDASNIPYSVTRLSGGEKALVGLCLRIALAEQAQAIVRSGRVKFLILDEVLSSLDDERCDAVQRIFADVQKRGIFEHIIMITHLDSVKQGWHANGLVVQKVDGKMSTVISVSPGEVPMDLAEGIEV